MSVEDTLYSEVKSACALCGAGGIHNLTKHHIDGDRTNNSYDNLIILCNHCHTRHNQGHIPDQDIESAKRLLIRQTLTQYGITAIKISHRNNYGVIAMPYLLYHLVDLGYMEKGEVRTEWVNGDSKVEIDNIFTLTKKGERLYERWLKDM